MRLILLVFFALPIFVFSGDGIAAQKYDREKICTGSNDFECDLLVEKTVAAEIPGVVERAGLFLRVRAKNGKVIERESTDPKCIGEPCGKPPRGQTVWVCDYFPKYAYIQLCYRLWESLETEFVNIETSASVAIPGFPRYSPSGRNIFLFNGYGGETYSIEIWHFEKNKLVNEFRAESPPGEYWDNVVWKSENEILPKPYTDSQESQYRLVKRSGRWTLREQSLRK